MYEHGYQDPGPSLLVSLASEQFECDEQCEMEELSEQLWRSDLVLCSCCSLILSKSFPSSSIYFSWFSNSTLSFKNLFCFFVSIIRAIKDFTPIAPPFYLAGERPLCNARAVPSNIAMSTISEKF